MHYRSTNTNGYKYSIVVPVTGAVIPTSALRVTASVLIAGRTFSYSLPPLPNIKVTIIWDGTDFLGRKVTGEQIAHVVIGYEYQVHYSPGQPNLRAFAQSSLSGQSIVPSRTLFTAKLIQTFKVPILVHYSTDRSVAEGWTLNQRHWFENGVLYKGNGLFSLSDPLRIITQVAGGSSYVQGSEGIAVAADGSVYYTDVGRYIKKVSPDGIITTVAGTGTQGFSGDGGPATQAQLYAPQGIALANDGTLYIASTYNKRIRKISPDGIITTVAGTGVAGFSGDGGPATQTSLSYPYDIAIAADGSLYIADTLNYRIRKISPDGFTSTVAGTGVKGFSGDGGPATQAKLFGPYSIAVGEDGSLYIAETYNNRVRKVSPDGIITTVAGTGTPGFSGDGGPATQAKLFNPMGVAITGDGNLYIADRYNFRIRQVSPSGAIYTESPLFF